MRRSRVPPNERVSTPVPRRRRPLPAAVIGVVSVVASACSGGDGPGQAQQAISVSGAVEAVDTPAATPSSRTGEGIAEAGGAVRVGDPCPAAGEPARAGTATIAVVTPDIERLDEVGLGALVFDPGDRTFEAYINEINSLGGMRGTCFEFSYYEYGFTDIATEIGAICAELPTEQPLVMFGFVINEVIAGCTTLAAGIPTIGLYSQFPEAFFDLAGGLLLVDHGSLEFLLDNGMRTAADSGVLAGGDRVGLLYSDDDSAASLQATFERVAADLGLDAVAAEGVPVDLFGTAMVVTEERFRSLGGQLFGPDEAMFADVVGALPPDVGDLLARLRAHFLNTAEAMRAAGVETVVATASWDAVRNLMRAAEAIGWRPRWVTNDTQFPMVVLTDAPPAQALNLVQVSSHRAADDPIDGLDRGCLSLRNTGTAAEPFSHRYHTDAWSVLTTICDYLDVVFGAASRVDGPLTREALLAELRATDYRAAHGQRVRFGAGDSYGSDGLRVLGADPDCVLNEWGCMRALSGWFEPATAAGDGS